MLCVGLYGVFLALLQSLTFGAVESVGEQMFTNTTCTACQGLLCEDKDWGIEPQSHFELSPGITALVMVSLSLLVLVFRDTIDSWVCGLLGVVALKDGFLEQLVVPVKHIFVTNLVFYALSVTLDSSQQPTGGATMYDYVLRQIGPLCWVPWVLKSRTYSDVLWSRERMMFVILPLRTALLLVRPPPVDKISWQNYTANVVLFHFGIGIITNTSVAQHMVETFLITATANFAIFLFSWNHSMFNNVGICVLQLLAIIVKRVYLNWLQARQVAKRENSLTTYIRNSSSIALLATATHLICQVLVLADFKSQRLFNCLRGLFVEFMRRCGSL